MRVTKALGVYLDEFLSWDKHIDNISKNISSGIGAIKRLKPCVDHETLKSVYNAFVLPHFDYYCEVWDSIGITLSDRLQKLQNRATRVIMGRKNIHGQSEIAYFVARLMYKITYDLASKSLTEIFRKSNASLQYNLRGSFAKFHLPQPRSEYLKKSLSYRGAHLWNSLSIELRNKESLHSFNSSFFNNFFNRSMSVA